MYAFDAFARTTNSGWGRADAGGTYTSVGSAREYFVSDGLGRMNLPKGGMSRGAILEDVSERDIDSGVAFSLNKLPSAGSASIYALARRSGNSEYRGFARITSAGEVL